MRASSLRALAAVAMAAWLLSLGLVMLATRPARRRVPSAGPPESTVDYPVPAPALAALLCPPDGRVRPAAALATLLDLVARGLVSTAWDTARRPRPGAGRCAHSLPGTRWTAGWRSATGGPGTRWPWV